MTKELINLRIEKETRQKLEQEALNSKRKMSDIMRDRLDSKYSATTIQAVKQIINDLESPFVFPRTIEGKKYATEMRIIRNEIAQRLRRSFEL